MSFLENRLAILRQQGLHRSIASHSKELIDFSSNDYLGIARSKKIAESVSQSIETSDTIGSTGSRLLTGNFREMDALESQIAGFHEAETALIYPSGYQANVGLLSSLATRNDTLILDEYCHASLIDSSRLSWANCYKFKHQDLDDLASKLRKAKVEKFVVVEAIYSMNGAQADLRTIYEVCHEHNAHLIVDEAHSAGVRGSNGKGSCIELGIHNDVFARIITYGKAFGFQGGAVLGSAQLREFLVNTSRSFIYSTGVSPLHVHALSAAYRFVDGADEARSALRNNIRLFQHEAEKNGILCYASDTQIQAIKVPGNDNVIKCSEVLRRHGILAMSIRKPTVPGGEERIRICLHSFNTEQEIKKLIEIVRQWKGDL
ncbi:MAG: 8-amino-7-oxononanoate synthase [Bacteroidia bacterium]|nr:8-amino-7-oxononanoate synthase [Bacteroidia bacterium]